MFQIIEDFEDLKIEQFKERSDCGWHDRAHNGETVFMPAIKISINGGGSILLYFYLNEMLLVPIRPKTKYDTLEDCLQLDWYAFELKTAGNFIVACESGGWHSSWVQRGLVDLLDYGVEPPIIETPSPGGPTVSFNQSCGMTYAFSHASFRRLCQAFNRTTDSEHALNPEELEPLFGIEALHRFLFYNAFPIDCQQKGLWVWTIPAREILASHPGEKEWTISTIGELFKQYWSESPVTLRRVTPADILHSIYLDEDYRQIDVFAETSKGLRLLILPSLVVDFTEGSVISSHVL